MQINNYIRERVELICKDNYYLLGEPEVKSMIDTWQSDFDNFEFIIKCLMKQLEVINK